jgi:hypothetical protein
MCKAINGLFCLILVLVLGFAGEAMAKPASAMEVMATTGGEKSPDLVPGQDVMTPMALNVFLYGQPKDWRKFGLWANVMIGAPRTQRIGDLAIAQAYLGPRVELIPGLDLGAALGMQSVPDVEAGTTALVPRWAMMARYSAKQYLVSGLFEFDTSESGQGAWYDLLAGAKLGREEFGLVLGGRWMRHVGVGAYISAVAKPLSLWALLYAHDPENNDRAHWAGGVAVEF